MLVCPNKNSPEWKALVEKVSEHNAHLAFFRNNNEIPTVEKARQLTTDRNLLESYEFVGRVTKDEIEKILVSMDVVYEEPFVRPDGTKVFSLKYNSDQKDILSSITEKYGLIFKYGEEVIEVDDDALEIYNDIMSTRDVSQLSLEDLSRRFLMRLGVTLDERANELIERYGTNAISDLAYRMVRIQEGYAKTALPEEALHFFLEMIPQNDPTLLEAMDKIRSMPIYKEVLAKYSQKKEYQADGKVRFDKIKKEALAKQLAASMMSKEKQGFISRLLDRIIAWIKGVDLRNDPMSQLERRFLSGEISNLNRNIKSKEIFYQLNEETKNFYLAQNMNDSQRSTLETLLMNTAKVNFEDVGHKFKYADGSEMTSVTTVLGSDFYSELDNPEIIADVIESFQHDYPDIYESTTLSDDEKSKQMIEKILTDISNNVFTKEDLDEIAGKRTANLIMTAMESKRKTLFGTAMHEIVESLVLGKSVDLQKLSKDVEYFMDAKMLQRLIYEGGPNFMSINDIIKELKADGSVLVTEFEIGNGKLAGIIDLMAIKPDGSVKVYDFKTKFTREYKSAKPTLKEEFLTQIGLKSRFGVKNDPKTIPALVGQRRSRKDTYAQQQSLYKHLLMEAGITVAEINVIGIPYTLDKETNKIDKIEVVMVENLPFDKELGQYFFKDVNYDNDKLTRPKTLKEDPRIKELDGISKEKMKEAFARMMARINQVHDFFIRRKDSELSKLLTEEDGTSDSVTEQMVRLEKTLENYELFNSELQRQRNFIEMIDSSGPIIAKVAQAFDDLRKTVATDPAARSQKLKELMKMKDFLMSYQSMFEEILGYMSNTIGTTVSTDPENHILVNRIKEMMSEITNIRNAYVDSITPDIVNTLGEVFNPEMIDNIRRELNELIASAKVRKDTKRVSELETMVRNLPDQKVISDYLKGKKGDVGYFFSYLMATISNPDLVVAGVAKRLKAALDRVRLINKKLRDGLSTELSKRNAVYGTGLDMKARNESLVYDTKAIDESTGEEYMKRVIKTEFDLEKLYYDYGKLRYALKVEQQKENNEQGIKNARQAIKDFEKKFLVSDYTEEYEKVSAVLDTVVTYKGEQRSLRDIRNEIFDKINAVSAKYHSDEIQAGIMTEEDILELTNHWANYHELFQRYDVNGNPKTGEDLKIADLLEKYREDTKEMYEEVLMTGAFERAKEKQKILFGEDSENYREWIARNTRLVTKDQFYTDMEDIINEMNSILPSEKNVEITELYKELRKLTNAFKDKDNNIQGHLMDPDTVRRVKQLEERIRELRDDREKYSSRGLTFEEEAEFKDLLKKKNRGDEYNETRYQFLIALGKNRRNEYEETLASSIQNLFEDLSTYEIEEKKNRYNELRKKLITMRKQEVNPHYYTELHKRMHDFAISIGLTGRQDVERDMVYLRMFHETDWFLNNHKFSPGERKREYEGEDDEYFNTSYSYEPIYIWKRSMPVDEYIERQPASHFYKRKVKDSYVNAKGDTIQLRNKDTRDILNRRKPKTNEQYRIKNGTDHPYLNREYIELRKRVQNNSASEKEKVDYENLLYLQKTMVEAQEKIEMSQRLGFAVPFMEKSKTERIVETKGQNIIEGAGSMFTAVKRAFKRTEDDLDEGIPETASQASKLATVDNEQIRYIPVRYRSRGEMENASYDVWGGVLNYVASINRKVEMETELAFINGLEEILGDKMNQPKSETGNLVFNKVFKKYNISDLDEKINLGSNRRLDVIKSFVNSVMYNEEYFSGIDIMGINTQKTVSQLMGLSSFAILAAAPLNWTTNLVSGNVQNIIEALGGKNFTLKDYSEAKGVIYGNGVFNDKYGSVVKDMMSDFDKVGNLSFWGQMMELFDPIQGEFENEYGVKTKYSGVRNILKLGPFAGKIWGEWEIQMTAFIAFMKSHKLHEGRFYDRESYVTKMLGADASLTMYPGEYNRKRLQAIEEFGKIETSLLDVFTIKDGSIAVKDEFAGTFNIGDKQFSDIVAKLHAMQKVINGSYASFDRSMAEKTSFGRMIFFFRKYVIPLAVNRWGQMRVNYESMSVEQGFYLTFLQLMRSEIKTFGLNIIKNWDTYSDLEKRAIKRTLGDIAMLIAIFAMYSLILGWDEDDKDRFKKLKKKSWGHQAMVYVLLKVKSETEQFLPLPGAGLNEIQRIYSNPSLILNEVTRYFDLTGMLIDHTQDIFGLNSDNLYYTRKQDDSGLKDKGDSKLVAKMFGTIGYTGRTFHPLDAIKSFEYSQRLK